MARWSLIDTTGAQLYLEAPYRLREVQAIGMAPVQTLAQRSAYRDGERHERSLYGPYRVLMFNVDIVGAQAALPGLRDALYVALAGLQDGSRVRVERDDGSVREIVARIDGEMRVPSRPGVDGPQLSRLQWAMRASQPHWYNPAGAVWTFAVSAGLGSWGFDLGYPEGFGASTIDTTETKDYPGQVDAYPIIRVRGPVKKLVMENLSLGTELDFSARDIAPGETVTFDLREDYRTITSDTVPGSLLPYLAEDSHLSTWRIGAHPKPPGGRNSIRIYLEEATSNTQVSILWHARYLGV